MKKQSIRQYIIKTHMRQFLLIVTLIYLLSAIILFFSAYYRGQRYAYENAEFVGNYAQNYFSPYLSRFDRYNQNQNVRNLLSHLSHRTTPSEQDMQKMLNTFSSQADTYILANDRQVYPTPGSKVPDFSRYSRISDNSIIWQDDRMYYIMPYYNFVHTQRLGSICFSISRQEFANYLDSTIPSELCYSMSDSLGNVFLTKNTASALAVSHTSASNRGLLQCTVHSDLLPELRSAALSLMGLLLVCILAYLYSLWLSKRTADKIAAPINQLSLSFQHSNGGELGYRTLPESNLNEIDNLSHAYAELMICINELVDQNHKQNLLRIESQLSVLQAKINPHFLFNTLELIRSQAILEDAGKTAVLIQKLGQLFRYSLKSEDAIALHHEVQYAKDYLYLQNIRYNEMIRWEINTAPEFENVRIPKMTLQPLLENCFQHAFRDMCPSSCVLKIDIVHANNHMIISVCDNGCGMSREVRQALERDFHLDSENFSYFIQREQHIGLRNVNARLCIHFKTDQALSIQTADPGGTRMVICVPFPSKEEDESC